MKIICGEHDFSKDFFGCVLTIGNFDGVHRGHQVLLQKLRKEGNRRGLPVVVILFEPQPLELFKGDKAPARLMHLREKISHIEKYGVDYILCEHFNYHFAALTAQDFIDKFLVKRLGVQFLAVGDDFHFGARRKGDFSLLQKLSLKYGFEVFRTKTLYEDDVRVSSTAVRKALKEDDLQMAERLLGYPFFLSGYVSRGDKLGRKIGFPTANVLLHRRVSPIKGVYAVEVAGLDRKLLPGFANIGTRPTISSFCKELLEVHLFDTDICIYGRCIDVVLRKKIRNERQFLSLENLKKQIVRDELVARDFFENVKSSLIPKHPNEKIIKTKIYD